MQNLAPLIWFLVGFLLILGELLLPGIVFVFFGAGAWVTAALIWAGVIESLPVSLLVFSVSSALLLGLLRKFVVKTFKGKSSGISEDYEENEFIGKLATVSEEIDAKRNLGKIEFRGVVWIAASTEVIASGQTVRIIGRENLTMRVERA